MREKVRGKPRNAKRLTFSFCTLDIKKRIHNVHKVCGVVWNILKYGGKVRFSAGDFVTEGAPLVAPGTLFWLRPYSLIRV